MNLEMNVDILIIGGGSAGLAAAIEAKNSGIDNLIIIERDRQLGGILNQCIHNGFGLHTFKEELTGPEYAFRYIQKARSMDIPYLLDSMVVDISVDNECHKKVTVMSLEKGLIQIHTKAIVLAMGCRERSRGALNIPGYRPAGIYTAGTAQHFVNMLGRMPGKEIVILGSGDIGLIMARRLTLEGANVKLVTELMPYSGGLKRNIVQCLDDYNIPLKLSHTVVDIEGKDRVTGVTIAQVDEHLQPIDGTQEYIACDTVLLSCGLIPENELLSELENKSENKLENESESKSENETKDKNKNENKTDTFQAGIIMNRITAGPMVNESFETTIEGIFACGNALHVHDLVDFVSKEAEIAGKNAALFVKNELGFSDCPIVIQAQEGVRYTVPSTISVSRMAENQSISFRVDKVFHNSYIAVYCNDQLISRQRKKILAPGEMQRTVIKKEILGSFVDLKSVTLKIEQDV